MEARPKEESYARYRSAERPTVRSPRLDAQPYVLRVGSLLCLVQMATEGSVPEAKPKEPGAPKEASAPMEVRRRRLVCRRRLVRRGKHVRRRRFDVEDKDHLCHAHDHADGASWRQSVAAPSCTKEESRTAQSEHAAKQEIFLGAMRGDP